MNIGKISIIVPCFNEDRVITKTHERLLNTLNSLDYSFEIIYINDGSKDATFSLLKKISANNNNVKILSLSRNFGHQAAVSAGLKYCTGELAIIIDADLQDPPELFPKMIQTYLDENCNGVYGVRKKRKNEGFLKKITASIFYRILNFLSDVPLPVDTGDFRLIDRKIIDAFNSLKEKNKYIRGLISWMGFKQVPFYYNRDPRLLGETKYTFKKMYKLATTGLLYFSRKPLQLSLGLGFFTIFVSLLLIIYVFVSKFSNSIQTIPGWASTLIVIIFFGGVQLFVIGVLGEYIGNIFDELKSRPEYIIAEQINFDENVNKK